jgi:hypothetical protein
MAKLTKEQKQRKLIKWAKSILAWYQVNYGVTILDGEDVKKKPPPPPPPQT